MDRNKKRIRTRKMIILDRDGIAGKRLPPFFFRVVRRFFGAGFLVRVLVIGQ